MNDGVAEASEREFSVTRVFDAPRGLVWQAYTEAERLAQWWGPKGFSMRVVTLDLRPGGMFLYSMHHQNSQEMWGRFVYREIIAPERLVFINSFSDAAGAITRNSWSATWPLEIFNTLTFSEHEGKTTLTMRGGPHAATLEEQATFEAAFGSLQQGFTGTLDQLEDYLATA